MKRTLVILVSLVLSVIPLSAAQTPVPDVLPIITGDFMQGWQFAPFDTPEAMNAHFTEMANAGIRYIILCDSARVGMVSGTMGIIEAYYPSSPSLNHRPILQGGLANHPYGNGLIESMFLAAQNTGIKIFLGLGYDRHEGGWWSNNLPFNRSWYRPRAEFSNLIAQDLYDQFKSRFPDVFYGWYFPYEFFNNMRDTQDNVWHFADFMNINRDFLWALDPSMPFLISPFFAGDHRNVEDTRAELTAFFEQANFRPGDIYAPQDSVGTLRTTVPLAGQYFQMIREVMNATAPGIRFWANNENFIEPGGLRPGPVSRLLDQINVTNPFVEKHISFSFSHYYSTLIPGGNTASLNTYRTHYQSILAQFVPLPGDVNNDGVINAADVTLLRRYIAAADKTAFRANNPSFHLHNANVDFDGQIDANDVSLLRRYLAAAGPEDVRLGP
jgi:hypothetical protein